VTVTHNFVNVEPRVVAIDAGGAEHIGQARGSSAARNFAQLNVLFDVPLDQLKTLDFQTRVYDHIVDFRNITLDPKQHTNVELIMQPAKP
jgi:hypothetical protein